jgi:hypothetical protein
MANHQQGVSSPTDLLRNLLSVVRISLVITLLDLERLLVDRQIRDQPVGDCVEERF